MVFSENYCSPGIMLISFTKTRTVRVLGLIPKVPGCFHKIFATVAAIQQTTVTPLDTSCVPLWTCICSYVETIVPWKCQMFGFWIPNTPRYFSWKISYISYLSCHIPPPPSPRGILQGYIFLKAYTKCFKMSHVSTLAVGAFRIFWVKREEIMQKSLKIGNNF